MKLLRKFLNKATPFLTMFALSVLMSVSAFASEPSTPVTADTVLAGLTTGLTSAQTYTFQGINNALPLALAVAGVIIAVTIGWRIFKRMSRG